MTASSQPEGSKASSSPQGLTKIRRRLRLIVILASMAGIFILLAGIYYAAGYILVRQVNAGFAASNCAKALAPAGAVEKFFPLKVVPFIQPALAQAEECRAYMAGVAQTDDGDWSSAYGAYGAYLEKYPQGQFSGKAQEEAAQALLAWAGEEQQSGDYKHSVEHLLKIRSDFAGTTSMDGAAQALPQVYFEWAASLQEQKNYPDALEKYDQAIKADPKPANAASPGSKAQAALPALYRVWGEDFLHKGDYRDANLQLLNAIRSARAADIPTMQDVLSEVLRQWAVSLPETGAYQAALEKIDQAASSAAGQAAREKAQNSRVDILSAFSHSDGWEAQDVMNETLQDVCADSRTAYSALVALDPETVRALPLLTYLGASSGTDISLSEDLAAREPASLHYAACMTSDTKKIETCPYTHGYFLERWRYVWKTRLVNVQTGEVYKETEIQGSAPDTCPYSFTFTQGVFTHTFYGEMPATSDLETWLSAALKNAPAATPGESAPEENGAPVLDSVNLHYADPGGKMVAYQDFTFHDPDGDATTLHYELVDTTAGSVHINDGQINTSAVQQPYGDMLSGQWTCGGQYEVTLRVTILDEAGHSSNPQVYTIYCR